MIAIDPGAKGGIAWMCQETSEKCCRPMPETNGDLLAVLRDLSRKSQTCYIEHVVGFIPGGGAGAMFTFGENFGYLQGCLDALGFRVIRVRPQKWQKALSIGGKAARVRVEKDATKESRKLASQVNAAAAREWKNKLKAEAQRRFPNLKVTLDTADALLILDYALSNP